MRMSCLFKQQDDSKEAESRIYGLKSVRTTRNEDGTTCFLVDAIILQCPSRL